MANSKSPNTSKHVMELMSAALPYVGNRTKSSMELMIKAGELMDHIENKQQDDLSACDLGDENVDMIALLEGIEPACTNEEKEFVNLVLNFSKAQNLYQNYQTSQTTQTAHEPQPTPKENMKSNSRQHNRLGLFQSSPMMDLLMSQLPAEQKSNFDSLSMMLQAMNL